MLFKRPLDGHNLSLALGECIAHLNYLHQRGQLARELNDLGQHIYRSVDDTLHLRLRRNAVSLRISRYCRYKYL